MSDVTKVEEVIKAGLISHERIFPILNKLDKIYNHHSNLSLFEIMNLLASEWSIKQTGKSLPNDLELTQLMDEYIDKYNISTN